MLNSIGQRKTIFLLLMLMGVIGACDSPYTTPVQELNTFTASPTVAATPIPALPTSAKVTSPTITAAGKFEPAPPTPTPALILTLTFTPDPRPTLSVQERESYLLEYFTSASQCELPCWLDITPGVTTFAEFQATIYHLGLNYAPKKFFNPKFKQQVTLGGLDFDSQFILNRITLLVEPDGVISGVDGDLHALHNPSGFAITWASLDIRQVLLTYGMPSSISIITDYSDAAGRVGYSVEVYYPEKGFVIYYNGGADYQNGVSICPHLKDEQLVNVVFSLRASPFREKENTLPGFYTELDTGFSLNELYALLTDEKGSCLNMPTDKFE